MHARRNPYAWLTGLLLCVSSYLCLANLNYSLLWDDEAHFAFVGKNLLETGTLTVWDGRNLDSFGEGNVLPNSKLQSMWPPLTYVFTAVGIYLFGYNETGARSICACIGVLALVMFLLLLRLYLPDNSRLVFFVFLFVSLSPQLLLYFRSAHYFAFAVFGFIACIYFYERYWRSGRLLYLISLTIIGLLSFLNHYSVGAAGILAIAVYHLILRRAATSRKQWLMFSMAGFFIVLLGFSYLFASESLTSAETVMSAYERGTSDFTLLDHILKLFNGIMTILAVDWLSWLVCLWFLIHQWFARKGKGLNGISANQTRQLILLGMLFFTFSVLLSPQRPQLGEITALRYSVAALPLFLVMKGMLINWLISKEKILGSVVLAALLSSTAGAHPFDLKNGYTDESIHGFHLLSFIKEIHTPYKPDPIDEVAKYLHKYANYDDLVYTNVNYYRRNLIFYIGNHVLLCCQINKANSKLSVAIERMRDSLFFDAKVIPDWIIVFRPNEGWDLAEHIYTHNWTPTHIFALALQTQRPEIDIRRFEPYPEILYGGVIIFKRKKDISTWF